MQRPRPDRIDVPPKLTGPLATRLEVGRGNVLFLEGLAPNSAVGEQAELALAIGEREVAMLSQGLPERGEVRGSALWQALCPLPAIGGPERAAIRLLERRSGTTRATHDLGLIELEPGEPFQADGEGDLVAICMATHDPDLALLRIQIESIREQSHRNWVCLLSDDATPVAKWTEIERLVKGDERFELSHAGARGGVYRNFERALKRVPSRAAFVAFADQDDRWEPDKLAALLEALGPGDVLAHSDARVVTASGEVLSPTLWPRGAPDDQRLSSLIFANAITGASCVFRSSLLKYALPFPALPGRAFHDRWLALVATCSSGGVRRVKRPLYDYVQHGGAVMGHARLAGTATGSLAARAGRAVGGGANWRASHDEVFLRTLAEAMSLWLRFGTELARVDERLLLRIGELPDSPGAGAWVGARSARRAARRAPGIEGDLVRALAWRRTVPVREALVPLRARQARLRYAGKRTGRTRAQDSSPVLGITLTDDDPGAGFGDYYTAHELGDALRATGLEVAYVELADKRWRGQLEGLDALLCLLDRFPVEEVPPEITCLAWVRNWTERWLSRPGFKRFDHLLASSRASCELIADRAGKTAELMPLATNPNRFAPQAPDPDLACDVLFAGNSWGRERAVASVLPELARTYQVRAFGAGWEGDPSMAALVEGPIAYERLPEAYGSACVVLDDSGPHALPYGALNSRVFDALAAGAPVVTNDAAGAAELFDDGFPTWADAGDAGRAVGAIIDDPRATAERTAGYRDVVLRHHTYEQRARQIVSVLDALGQASSAAPSPARRRTRVSW